jgi:hypothetical protein
LHWEVLAASAVITIRLISCAFSPAAHAVTPGDAIFQ